MSTAQKTELSYVDDPVRPRLEAWSARGELYALVDSFFQIPVANHDLRKLETRDTDPVFFELIAWDQVTYQPPYLIKVDPSTLQWILNSLSTERWGMFVAAKCDLETLARHFQKFIVARGPDGNPYFLRFQDASVLEVLLKTWDAKECAVFFGESLAFGLPDLDSMNVRLIENAVKAAAPRPEDCLIQLRESQLRLCGEAIDRDLVKVIYWHLRNHHSRAVQFIDKKSLDARLHFSIQRARKYGLATISDLAGFCALMFELAPNFDEHPSFRQVLQSVEIPPEEKMRCLSKVITDREWSEAQSLYDRAFWPTALKK